MLAGQLDMSNARVERSFGHLLKHVSHAVAKETLEKYSREWKKWREYCDLVGQDPMNCPTILVAFYLASVLESSHVDEVGVSRFNVARSAINFFYTCAGKESSPTEMPVIVQLAASANKYLTANHLDRSAMSAETLHKILEYHNITSPTCSLRTLMHLTVFLLMFVGMLRFSDVSVLLVHEDLLKFIYDGDKLLGVLIYICKSKTDQTWKGNWVAIGATGKKYCPASMLLRLLQKGGYVTKSDDSDVGPLLRAVRFSKDGHVLVCKSRPLSENDPIPSLSYSAFNSNLKQLVAEAGILEPITCHSGRIGAASEFFINADHDVFPLVRKLGRWSAGCTYDDVYARPHLSKYFALTSMIWPF